MNRVVLIGGGVAAAAAATGLRDGGYDGAVVLVSDEPHVPYERPPLSKEFLNGACATTDFVVNPEAWYADNGVELVLGARAVEIEPGRVTLAEDRSLSYDALVLATGVRARTLPGLAGERVHSLRTIEDSTRLGERLTPGRRLGILGGGFVGCEVAAIAAARGVEVTLFERGPLPLGRALGAEIGSAMLAAHGDNGVEICTGTVVSDMSENAAGVVLRTGAGLVECDELLVGVGSLPNVELAAAAGVSVDGGIVTDEYGRTSVPNVYAIGDVAARFHPAYGRRVRVEHHDTAVRHGVNLARNLLGQAEPFSEEHFFWSDQYDHKLQSIGRVGLGEQVIRGSVAERSFAIFSLDAGRITGMVAMNRPGDLLQTRKLLAVPHETTADQLADTSFQLKSLLPRRAGARQREVRV